MTGQLEQDAARAPAPGLAAATAPATGIAELGAERDRERTAYGAGALIVCDRVVRIYAGDGIEVQALQGLDLLITAGELTAIIGASGSGKSTLMNILAGLDSPTAGSVRVAGNDLSSTTARQRLAYRRAVVGFIWQQTSRNLLSYLTGRQNVLVPMRLRGTGRAASRRRAGELLDALGVGHCADRVPEQMSGGEQQRTAIAAALANQPKLLLADEPTGELDSATARDVFAALQTANTELGATVLVVTHDPAVSAQVRRTIAIRDGRISSETLRTGAVDAHGNVHAAEYAVLDRAGRVQLPRAMVSRLGMRDRVRLGEEADHVGVWPDRGADPAAPAGPAAQAPARSRPSGRPRLPGPRHAAPPQSPSGPESWPGSGGGA